MEAGLRSWFEELWKQIKQHPYTIGVVVVLVVMLFIFLAYWFGWGWTGVNGGVSKVTTTTTSTGQPPAKTLWDWLQLLAVLAVPIVVGFGAVWFTARYNHDVEIAREQHENEQRITLDNQREATLQAYLDKISELLLKEHLDERTADGELKPEYEQVRKIAHVRTLAVLPALDGKRKGTVLQFIYESKMINKNQPIISLIGADLRGADVRGVFYTAFPWDIHGDIVDTRWENMTAQYGANLSGANLFGAVLNGANLSRVNLSRADLHSADLRNANLSDADLSEANLHEANLHEAILIDAELRDAILYDADLSKAYLRGAIVYADDLSKAKSLDGATMPNGKIRDPGKSISSQL